MSANDTYYKKEDDPNLTPQQAAVDIYRDAKAKLAHLDVAQANMDEVFGLLQVVWGASEDEAHRQRVDAVWASIQAVHAHLQQADGVVQVADSAIGAMDEQRRNAVDELNKLVQALEDGDDSDPRVESYRIAIEDEASEAAWDYVSDNFDRPLCDWLENELPAPLATKAYLLSMRVVAGIGDPDEMTDEQKKALLAFALTFTDAHMQGVTA